MSDKRKPATRTEEQQEKRKARDAERKEVVDELIRTSVPLLWAREPGSGIAEDQVEAIIGELGSDLTTRQLAKAIQHLRSRLRSLGRKTGGEVFLPMAAVTIKSDPSPYRDNAIESVCRLNQMHEAFNSDLSDFPEKSSGDWQGMDEEGKKKQLKIMVGRILYSAVVNGGLLNESLLWRLPAELVNNPIGHEQVAWVTFVLGGDSAETPDKRIDKEPPVRRWFVDYVTLGLIIRLLDGCSPSQQKEIAEVSGKRALTVYLDMLRRNATKEARLAIGRKSGESSFFGAAAVRLSYTMPPVLLRFLKSIRLGESMSERSWWRYQFERSLPFESDDQPKPDFERISPSPNESTKPPESMDLQGVHQQRIASKLKRCFKQNRKDEKLPSAEALRRVQKALDNHSGQMSPLLNAIFHWFRFLLSDDLRKEGAIRSSSAATYRSRIVQPMIDTNWEFDITDPNPEVWEEFYSDTLISITAPVQRKHAITTIRWFHQYMMVAVGAPPVLIEGSLEEGARTRNSILSESDYQAVRNYLHSASGDSYFLLLLEVIVIMMFRAGLRPNDIVGLKFRHIAGVSLDDLKARSSYPVIYPRSIFENTLKTSAAVRQVPLPWLVPPDELDVVLEFFKMRQINCQSNGKNISNSWVFSGIRNSESRMPSARYFGYLSNLLSQICEDPGLVSYSLRHSFLSNWALKIFNGEIQDPDHPMLRPACLPREIIYTLSTLAAHETPDITLGTYINTLDLAAFSFTQQRLLGMKDSVRSRIECCTVSALKQRRAQARSRGKPLTPKDELQIGYQRLVAKVEAVPPPKLTRFVYEGLPEKLTEPNVAHLDLSELFQLCKYLAHHGDDGVAAAKRIFSITEQEITGVRDHGRALGSLSTSTRGGASRSRMLRQDPDRKPVSAKDASRKKNKSVWTPNRRAGDIAPALPASHDERLEADRIYRLLIHRAGKAKWRRKAIEVDIVDRLAQLFVNSSVTERAFRIRSRHDYENVMKTLHWLRIPGNRVKVKIESLPREPACTLDEWRNRLVRWAPWKRVTIDIRGNAPRISRDHPTFGICLIQVLEAAGSRSDENDADTIKRSAPARVGASWRVGCYYSIIAIRARLDSIPD